MSNYQQTSLLAYKDLGEKIGQRQKQVLEVLRLRGEANNRQVSEYSHLPINVVTPRMNELVTMGKVKAAGKRHDPKTGRLTVFWRISDESDVSS